MKVFNKGQRQYMIGDVLIKPQQTANIDDKYKSIVESYKEFEIVEPEQEQEPEQGQGQEQEPEQGQEVRGRPRGRPRQNR